MASAPEKYEMAVYPMTVAVRSASDGAKVHQVHLAFCDCADFTNRKGQLAEIDGMPTVTICKHIAQAMALVGGWNREQQPSPVTNYPDLNRPQAMTVLTSHFINADLAHRVLLAAHGADGMVVAEPITRGEIRATYNSVTRRYNVQLPAGQPSA